MSGLRSSAVFALRRPRLSGARSSWAAASAGSISSTSSISDFSRKPCSSSMSASSRSISATAVAISAKVSTPTCCPFRSRPLTSSSSCSSTTDIEVLFSRARVAGHEVVSASSSQDGAESRRSIRDASTRVLRPRLPVEARLADRRRRLGWRMSSLDERRQDERPRQPARDAPHEVRRERRAGAQAANAPKPKPTAPRSRGRRSARAARPRAEPSRRRRASRRADPRRPQAARRRAGVARSSTAAHAPAAAASRRPRAAERHRARHHRHPGGRRAAQIGLASAARCSSARSTGSRKPLGAATFSARRIARVTTPGERGTQCGRCPRGRISRHRPAVALLSLREPVSSPRRQRRKPMMDSPTRIAVLIAAFAVISPSRARAGRRPAAPRRPTPRPRPRRSRLSGGGDAAARQEGRASAAPSTRSSPAARSSSSAFDADDRRRGRKQAHDARSSRDGTFVARWKPRAHRPVPHPRARRRQPPAPRRPRPSSRSRSSARRSPPGTAPASTATRPPAGIELTETSSASRTARCRAARIVAVHYGGDARSSSRSSTAARYGGKAKWDLTKGAADAARLHRRPTASAR